MKKLKELSYQELCTTDDVKQFKFKTTAELEDIDEIVGQPRAMEALQFGFSIKRKGYNLFAMGPSGVGKLSIVSRVVKRIANEEPAPASWCYVNNFDKPNEPLALQLPVGNGAAFKQDMNHLVKKLQRVIPEVYQYEEYQKQLSQLDKQCASSLKEIKEKNQKILCKIDKIEKIKQIQKEFVSPIIFHLIDSLKEKYIRHTKIVDYLQRVQEDIIENFDVLKAVENRYHVNVIIDSEESQGAPVIYEDHPTYVNLFGCMDQVSLQSQGTLAADFNYIHPGALHKANGGYLIIEIRKIVANRAAWDGLKRALNSQKIKIEPMEKKAISERSVTLMPQPIPLEVKVILIGSRLSYYKYSADDPEFLDLFKVVVDFDERYPRNRNSQMDYVRLISTIARNEGLLPFTRIAVTKIIDYGCRLIEDRKKLSVHMRNLVDLMSESNHWAVKAGRNIVDAIDVKKAIRTRSNRIDRLRDILYEDINRKFILIDTKGEKYGQINALTVEQIGDYAFGHPSRITAITRIGRGVDIVDIDREVELGGVIHSKSVLILYGYLRSHYALKQPLSLSASLVFEQTYDSIEGDSATAAELCVLLLTLANIPIKQSIAITGSMNQHGIIQAIGYVNEKIEGFFDTCKSNGLTGEHGVIIPESNVQSLMLKEEVVQAVQNKNFHIYPIKTIDEALTILSGVTAGKRSKKGKFPRNTINEKVERRLEAFAQEVIEEKSGE